MSWKDENMWERNWWGHCINTFAEEVKQFVYAEKMGLFVYNYSVDMNDKSVIDIGGGPVSFLLKCRNVQGYVVDPCFFPSWIWQRYKMAGIEYLQSKGEDFTGIVADEVWLYNCLQHTDEPKKVVENAKRHGKIVRVFEWVYTSIEPGHPHSFDQETLDEWFGGQGYCHEINEGGCVGTCYYGVFDGQPKN